MTTEPLMQIALETIEFFSCVSDSLLDPDVAVERLESISALLQQLPEADRTRFLRYVHRQSAEEFAARGRTERHDFLSRLGVDVGLE
jgi:hypothetical protein